MSSSEERREVAQNLRENATKRGVSLDYLGSEQVNSWWLLLHSIGCDSNHQDVAFTRLANLIDPTCHLWPLYDGGFGCDRCFTGFPEMKAKASYCPACGARVVSNDE